MNDAECYYWDRQLRLLLGFNEGAPPWLTLSAATTMVYRRTCLSDDETDLLILNVAVMVVLWAALGLPLIETVAELYALVPPRP